ncbi:hypothetical protein RB653_006229 [Dictyostelium firmibasis]|uniref:Ras GTPase-activating protein n=1 Tax=Dictyostelium firmibasis TaxID=79012 RepID=A0AAN7Z547_9MYCE
MATPPFGKVVLKILAARDTLVCDITTSDPYCLVSAKDSNGNSISQTFKTEVIYKTLNPVWKDEEFVLDVIGNSQIISILMYDEDKFSKDDFMGLIKINIDEYKTKGQRDLWIPLEGKNPNKKAKKRGDIHIQLCYYSFTSLTNYLIKGNHNLISKLSKQLISDDFGKAIMYYFSNCSDSGKELIDVVRDLASVEIEQTNDAKVLFRTDSLSTKVIVSIFKTVGFGYLKEALCPLIMSLIKNEINLEVDPSKGITEADAEQNAIQLSFFCSSFITAIKASLDQLPIEIRQICQIINELVEKKYPNDNIKSVGGFFFLRFVNPAIFSPEALGLISTPPSPNVRRTLTLVSKILQNISNQVTFSSGKEEYLSSFNSFISSRFDDFKSILQEISSCNNNNNNNNTTLFKSLKIDSSLLMKYTDTIIISISEKKQSIDIDQFNDEILSRYQIIQLQQKQESKLSAKIEKK